MKVYFVGPDTPALHYLKKINVNLGSFLWSYVDLKSADRHYNIKSRTFRNNLLNEIISSKSNGNNEYDTFLDSGAHAAYYSGEIISVEELNAFALRFRKYFDVICSLDVVLQPEQSMINYKDMVRAGIDDCLPVFHVGEPWEYLEKYCKMTDYVGIGGLVRIRNNPKLRAAAIQKALQIVDSLDKKTKIHLFGMTDMRLIYKFGTKIHSIDSSTWVSGQKYASVYNSNALDPTKFDYAHQHNNAKTGRMNNLINAINLVHVRDLINAESNAANGNENETRTKDIRKHSKDPDRSDCD